MSGLLDSLVGAVTSQLSGPLGAQLGEPPDAVKKGLETGSAAILGGMARKADDPGIMSKIFNMATGAGSTGAETTGGLPPTTAGDTGSGLLSTLFGSQQSSIMDTIGRVAGLKGSSVMGLMASLAPAVLGFLGSHIKSSGLNASGFTNLLKAEAPSISRALPAGLSIPGAATKGVAPPLTTGVAHKEKGHWVWAAVSAAVLLVGGLVWWASSSHKAKESPVAATPTVGERAPGAAYAGDMVTRKLPNGTELSIRRDGVEAQLIDNLESANIDNTKWFVFDRVWFDADSATLQAASREQLTNFASILKAFPSVNAKLGGYTDNTGDAAHNLKLSQERADSVMGELVKQGVLAGRLEAKGYGQENPIADNTTDAGRRQNSRVSMQLTKP